RSIDEAAEDLKLSLASLPKRLVVIVDDLDRMEFAALKDMLFVIKKCFSFPNVSFILCYDTQSIASLETTVVSTEKISEFLEKFVNLKVGLFPSAKDLADFTSDNLKRAAERNVLSNFQLLDFVMAGLREIYQSEDYWRYLPVLGDVRKLKRLLNTAVLLGIGKTDFSNSDFDSSDLVHLLLIYINYPG